MFCHNHRAGTVPSFAQLPQAVQHSGRSVVIHPVYTAPLPPWNLRKTCKTFSASHTRAGRPRSSLVMASVQLSWEEVATSTSDRPSLPRSGHAAAALPASHSHDVIIFGGYVEDEQKARQAANDAWTFSLASGKWEEVKYTSAEVPRVRLASQAVVVGQHLWLIAGWDPGHKKDGGDILSDLWQLDLDTMAWKQISPEGEEMPQISRFQAQAVGDRIYIHTHRSLQDILVLDVSDSDAPTLSLQPVTSDPEPPMSRGLHSLTAVGEDLILFAGAPKEGPMLGDLWALYTGSASWRELDAEGRTPHVRCSQAVAAADSDVFIFGGSYYKNEGGLQPLNDFIVLDTKEMQWRYPKLADGSGPLPRNAATLTRVGDKLVLYGGWNPFVETYNDTHVMDVSGVSSMMKDFALDPEEDW